MDAEFSLVQFKDGVGIGKVFFGAREVGMCCIDSRRSKSAVGVWCGT